MSCWAPALGLFVSRRRLPVATSSTTRSPFVDSVNGRYRPSSEGMPLNVTSETPSTRCNVGGPPACGNRDAFPWRLGRDRSHKMPTVTIAARATSAAAMFLVHSRRGEARPPASCRCANSRLRAGARYSVSSRAFSGVARRTSEVFKSPREPTNSRSLDRLTNHMHNSPKSSRAPICDAGFLES